MGKCFNKRDIMVSAFANTTKNFTGTLPSTHGEYNRKSLECSHGLETLFDDGVFGNPVGTELYFVFTGLKVTQIIMYMDKLRQSTERPISDRMLFGSYRLDKVFKDDNSERKDMNLMDNNNTLLRYVMIMTDIDTGVSIKCNATNRYVSDLRIQTLDYSGHKVFDAIPDLILRRVVHTENITKYIQTLIGTMPRVQRAIIWRAILRVLDINVHYLNEGYRYIDIGENKMIKISFEDSKPCYITCIPAPYMKVHLACSHELSIMAIYGLIYEGDSEDTESILCPVCRCNLIPKLVPAVPDDMLAEFEVKTYKEKDLKTVIDTSEFIFEAQAPKLGNIKVCDNQKEYIDEILHDNLNVSDDNESDTDESTVYQNTRWGDVTESDMDDPNYAATLQNFINYMSTHS